MLVQTIHIKDNSQIFVGEIFVHCERATKWLVHLPVFCLLLLNLFAFFHRFVCLHCDFPSSADGECVCMVRYTKGGSWQGYRGNTVCVRFVDELLPFPAIYPRDGLIVNYGSPTQRGCKRFHP